MKTNITEPKIATLTDPAEIIKELNGLEMIFNPDGVIAYLKRNLIPIATIYLNWRGDFGAEYLCVYQHPQTGLYFAFRKWEIWEDTICEWDDWKQVFPKQETITAYTETPCP